MDLEAEVESAERRAEVAEETCRVALKEKKHVSNALRIANIFISEHERKLDEIRALLK